MSTEARNLKLTLEQAKSLLSSNPEFTDMIYNSFPELKPKHLVLDRWEDIKTIKGYFINNTSIISETISLITNDNNKNVFATVLPALSSLAYAQLTQLMKQTGDCDIDWADDIKRKFVIRRIRDNIKLESYYSNFHFLAFNTKEIRDEFFIKHGDLIKQFYQL
jgi:hypothetical protein